MADVKALSDDDLAAQVKAAREKADADAAAALAARETARESAQAAVELEEEARWRDWVKVQDSLGCDVGEDERGNPIAIPREEQS